MTRRFGYFRFVLGAFLLLAGGLKLYGLGVSGVPRVGLLSAPGVQLAALQWEVVLGLWLISGKYPLGSWLAAVGTFVAFAGVSGYLGWIGQAHCGCFGAIKASPWHAFAIDLVALAALAWARPHWRSVRHNPSMTIRQAGGPILVACGGSALLFGLLAGAATWGFGSLDAAVAHLRGERISVRPDLLDVGRGSPGELVEAQVELINRTDRPVRIIGGTSDCSCMTTSDLPITIQPGESQSVSIYLRLPRTEGLFNRKAFFWTDDEAARTIIFPLTGRVDPPAAAPAANE